MPKAMRVGALLTLLHALVITRRAGASGTSSDTTLVYGKHCAGTIQSYSTLSVAESACSVTSACSGVYDSACDGIGPFALCRVGVKYASSPKSCVHVGRGMPTRTPTRTPTPAPTDQLPTWIALHDKQCFANRLLDEHSKPVRFTSYGIATNACLGNQKCGGIYKSDGTSSWP